MGQADGKCAAGVRAKPDAAAVQVQDRLALEDEEARLERVDVRVHVPVLELDQGQAGVHRAGGGADQDGPRQSAAVTGQRGLELDLLAADEPVALTIGDGRDAH